MQYAFDRCLRGLACQAAADERTSRVGMSCPPSRLALLVAKAGGGYGSRTHDLLNAIQALSQLS